MDTESLTLIASSLIIGGFLGIVLSMLITATEELIRYLLKKSRERNSEDASDGDGSWR